MMQNTISTSYCKYILPVYMLLLTATDRHGYNSMDSIVTTDKSLGRFLSVSVASRASKNIFEPLIIHLFEAPPELIQGSPSHFKRNEKAQGRT